MPLAVLDVELGALDAISPGSIATPAFLVTVLVTHAALHELILHAVGQGLADSPSEGVALSAGSAVVGERATQALIRAPVQDFD